MTNNIHELCKIYAKQNTEIEKLNKMLNFLIDQMPCIFDECHYKESDPCKCYECIRQWLENQIEE